MEQAPTISPLAPPSELQPPARLGRQLLGLMLVVLAAVAMLASIGQHPAALRRFQWIGLLALPLLAAPVLISGLWMARSAGLVAAPLLLKRGRAMYLALRGALWRAVKWSLAILAFSAVLTVSAVKLFGPAPKSFANSPPADAVHQLVQSVQSKPAALLAAVTAFSIAEEIIFRLLLMSVLILGVGFFWRDRQRNRPAHGAIWMAIAIQAVVFGFAHTTGGQSGVWWEPWYVQITVDARTYMGIVLGWMYWRYGLETSILTHVTYDLMVMTPVVATLLFPGLGS